MPEEYVVITYQGERIPVIAAPGYEKPPMPLISTDGRQWKINEERVLEVNGQQLYFGGATISRPEPQDKSFFGSLVGFRELDPEIFPPLTYPIPGR